MRSVDGAYRFAVSGFVVCLLALAGLLAVWVAYLVGPEVSVFDLGSPQIRVFV